MIKVIHIFKETLINYVFTCSIVGSGFFSSSIGLPTTIYNGFLNGIGDLKARVEHSRL